MTHAPLHDPCPDAEQISACVDGRGSPEAREHLLDCPQCRQTAEAYRLLDTLVRKRLAPPHDLAQRIRNGVARAAAQRPVPQQAWFLLPGVRLAAAVALTLGALTVLIVALRPNTPEATLAVAPPLERPATVHPPVSAIPDPANTMTRVDVGNLRPARETQVVGSGLARALPAEFRHVWNVEDVDGSARLLQGIVGERDVIEGVEQGNRTFTMVLPDRDVQQLVDRLAAERWELLSPEGAQPRKGANVAFSGRKVTYRLVLAGR
ncbi:MAG: hypothetical protein JXR77_18050 [Lentisphaeria bacterium]|nr:hypothetical protein [Lentisphaeria bacterium]